MTLRPQWKLTSRTMRQAFDVQQVPRTVLTSATRIRPWDGGLNTEDPPDSLDLRKMPSCNDVFFYRGELRKALGGTKVGSDFADMVLWHGIWQRHDGTIMPVAITSAHLYYYDAAGGWTQVNGGGGWAGFIVSGLERFVVQAMDDVLYFASDNNVLRSWDGDPLNNHVAVAGGFTARGMTVLNHHLILLATRTGATLEAQTLRFTQNGSVVFTGVGSGSLDVADREDTLQNIAKLGPFRALAYKDTSVVEVRVTGDANAPFEQSEIIPGLGLLCPYSLVEWAGGHLFMGSDEQIYNYSGSNLDPIGSEIVSDLFANLDHERRRDVVAGFDNALGEYIVLLPDPNGTGLKQYFAYNVKRRRWRSGEYPNASHITCGPTTVSGNVAVVPRTRYHTFIATVTKRIFRLEESAQASFDGTALNFNAHTVDFIAQEDGEEITIGKVRIGYVVGSSPVSVLVDASVDGGATWNTATNVTLGSGIAAGVVHYEEATFPDVTGRQIRIRLRNSIASESLRIRSLSPVPAIAEQARDAQQ